MKQAKHDQRSRLPKGIASQNPIPMRLSAAERNELEELAVKECRSVSSMARLVHLRGMAVITSE